MNAWPNGWGGYAPPPMPNIVYVPVNSPPQGQTTTQIDEMIKLLKAARKEQKKKESDKPKEEKKEEKKKDSMTYIQQVACWFAISPFIILANALVIGGTYKFLHGVFTGS